MTPESRQRRRPVPAAPIVVLLLVLLATVGASAACNPVPEPGPRASTAQPETEHAAHLPGLSAELNQFRDNYGKQIIEVQLTNTLTEPLTVLTAAVSSPLFNSPITWQSMQQGTAVPPGQSKSLPAQLPDAVCPDAAQAFADSSDTIPAESVLVVGLSPDGRRVRVPLTDPFGVLVRNNMELCVARAAASTAEFAFSPGLDISPDGATAVIRLAIRPLAVVPHGNGAAEPLIITIERVDGTTLIAEDPDLPWPQGTTVSPGGEAAELQLSIRPARCDPHAVAEDKVGTLIPLHVQAGRLRGILKVQAGTALKAAILDFVAGACARR
ncbi:hypothetical protein [Pseudarthrobacter sp. N5]|uniref:hypothetical protein n=1 Tax=Pseudarthrobacter sp. N5 TaxID=3418416 RepID=UPI003CE85F95